MIPLTLSCGFSSHLWGIKIISIMAKASKGLTAYQKKKIRKNLIYWFEQASVEQRASGIDWYQQAHEFCVSRAEHFGVSAYLVAGVVSALSPRNKWARNLEDATRVLMAWRDGLPPCSVKVCTFDSNKQKAFDILNGKPVNWGPKTEAFVKNIAHLDRDRVTVDVWHWRACFNKMRAPKSLTGLKYREIEQITIDTAEEFHLSGFVFQAVIWEVIRESWEY